MALSIIQPRAWEKDESIEQYLSYFADLKEANSWTESKAVAVFRTLIPHNSEIRSYISNLTAEQQASFTETAKVIKESHKPLRDTKMTEFFHLQRKNGQKLEELSNKVFRLVEELYSTAPKEVRTQLARDRFISSLNHELRVALFNSQGTSNLKTLTDAKNLAIAIESSSNYTNDSNIQGKVISEDKHKSNKWCSFHNSSSHSTENCRQANKSTKDGKATKHNSNNYVAAIEFDSSSEFPRQFIRIGLNNEQVLALVDTGTLFSTIPITFKTQAFCPMKASSANGSDIDVYGSSEMTITIDGHSLQHNFIIADVTTPIFGRDLLLKFKATVRYNNIMNYSFGNQYYFCPLQLEKIESNVSNLPHNEINFVREEDLSISDSKTTSECQVPVLSNELVSQPDNTLDGIDSTNLTEQETGLKEHIVINQKQYGSQGFLAPSNLTIPFKFKQFEQVIVGIMKDHPPDSGNKYLLTLQDYRTKWVEAVSMKSVDADSIIRWMGGLSAYHHQSNGQIERYPSYFMEFDKN